MRVVDGNCANVIYEKYMQYVAIIHIVITACGTSL